MEATDVLTQINAGTMQVLAVTTQNTLKQLSGGGEVLYNDLVKSAVMNPDTMQEVLTAAATSNSAVKMGYPPNSPDVSDYARIKALIENKS